MSLDSTHPEYDAVSADFTQMKDTFAGERVIKEKGITYLRATSSMVADGALSNRQPGLEAYQAYRDRAIFPEVVYNAASAMAGVLGKTQYAIELPKELESIRENATNEGETLSQLIRRIHVAQLVFGRIGLLMDSSVDRELPFFVSYSAQSITNWDDENDYLNFVVASEMTNVAQPDFSWTEVETYRAMYMANGIYATRTETDGFESEEIVPTFRGRTLNTVPFTFINANDLEAAPGIIPLLGSANAALSIYAGEADLRQSLHLLGQETLVITGVSPGSEMDDGQPTRVGAGAIIELPEGASAQFIGLQGVGLSEQRQVLAEDYRRAAAEGARLLENTNSQAESGAALNIRLAAKTATLRSIARVSALGLETALKQMAEWVGADASAVKVTPNTDFSEERVPGQDVLNIMQAKQAGLPMSFSSIHAYLDKHDVTNISFEDEVAQIAAETEILETITAASKALTPQTAAPTTPGTPDDTTLEQSEQETDEE
tara:strand:- start:3386 stop:4855 length:1470 start_codon:yes stop_codon:yes gene_type:complete